MTKDELQKLLQEIESISSSFETEPWTENIRLLKSDFDIKTTKEPKQYIEFIDSVSEVLRQARVLFLHSALNRVCLKDGVAYSFKTPYQANMKYSAVMKKEGAFYILDEDQHYRDIFVTEKFMRFVQDQYWELLDS
jgi:predicted transcriptional regulator